MVHGSGVLCYKASSAVYKAHAAKHYMKQTEVFEVSIRYTL